MEGRVAFDTTFLIDLQRERSRGEADGPAHTFLRENPQIELHLSATALGEFAEGFEDPGNPILASIRSVHVVMPVDEETAFEYARITRRLRRAGKLIGTNDLWIAAASVRHGLPLVTANPVDFGRVKGLEVVAHR